MEPISFAMGAVALAGLFTLCVECFDLIEVSRNLGADYEILIVKLSIEKRRLMIWGEAVGVLRPDTDRDQFLDAPETHALIERILLNMQKMFHDAEAMQGKYGLEEARGAATLGYVTMGSSMAVEGSTICAPLFAGSPVAQFQRRVVAFQQRAGLVVKTRWAIRDRTKFSSLIANVKDLMDGLHGITPASARTAVVKADLVRQETASIPDLRTLKIIEETCEDADWRSSASAASAGLNSVVGVSSTKRAYVDEWVEGGRAKISSTPFADADIAWMGRERSRSRERMSPRPFQGSHEGEYDDYVPKALRLELRERPYCGFRTEVLVMCSTTALVAYLPWRKDQHFHPVNKVPITTSANNTTYARVMKPISFRNPLTNDSQPCIAIYCPPRMRYVHMALRFLDLDAQRPLDYHCQIRFDDRLLDRNTSFDTITERMEGYHRELEDAEDTKDAKVRRIVDAIDMNWLEQRIDFLTLPASSYRPPPQPLDWYSIFRQSHDDGYCAGIIVMAGDETCRTMFNTAPVTPPDAFRGDGRVYRLRELDRTTREPGYIWKAEHYCNIAADKDFDNIANNDS